MLHDWLSEWWKHYGRGNLKIATVRRNGSLVAALPLFVRSYGGIRVARFLGGEHSALADLMIAEDADPMVLDTVLDQVTADDYDVADLFGLPADSRLAAAVGPRNLTLFPRIEAPVLELSAGWEAVYREKTSSKQRNLHKRRRRQLAELGKLETSVARTPEELEPALHEAFRLHRLRFSGRPDRSGFGTPTGMRFHLAAARALARMDIPRIVTLKLDGRAIAFHYYFALCGCMYVHRLAFDEAYSRFSPGLVTTLEAIAVASAEGLTRVEFLGGAERYKVDLADRLEPLYQGVGLATTVRGRTVAVARIAGLRLRKRMKRSDTLRHVYFDRLQWAHRVRSRIVARIQRR